MTRCKMLFVNSSAALLSITAQRERGRDTAGAGQAVFSPMARAYRCCASRCHRSTARSAVLGYSSAKASRSPIIVFDSDDSSTRLPLQIALSSTREVSASDSLLYRLIVPKPASGHREFLSGRAAATPVHPWRRRRHVALAEPTVVRDENAFSQKRYVNAVTAS